MISGDTVRYKNGVQQTDVCETGFPGSEKNIPNQEKVSQNPCHNQRLKTHPF